MGQHIKRVRQIFCFLLCFPVLVLLYGTPVDAAGGKLLFTAIVEHPAALEPRVILEWGPLEGEIPLEIDMFKLYRAEGGGGYQLVTEISFQPAAVETLDSYIHTDEAFRTNSLIQDLDRYSQSRGGQPITINNAAGYLHQLLDSTLPDHDPLLTMLLTRAHLSAARGLGLAYIDTTVNTAATYSYILTAVANNTESKPIGQIDGIQPATETILPVPTGLSQVRLDTCSALGGGRDDNAIHYTWDVPSSPQDLALKAVTYGYDLFWAENDEGTVNLRAGIPTQLHRVNQEPVVVAGPPPTEGPNSFLAKDGPANHTTGPAWKRGQQYWYYLVAKDISGQYCGPVTPVPMRVVDAMPPHAVWNAHSQEIKDPADDSLPRLALVWDAPDPVNFARYYRESRTFCPSDPGEICWVNPGESCETGTPRCADLSVEQYRIFRFDSPQDAAAWGQDSDGDLWPDAIENDPANNTDSCDHTSYPSGILPLVATIDPNNPDYSRYLNDNHRQIFFIDTAIAADNKVHWYRVLAVDLQGNQSALSPPLRGVLYDRNQPEPVAEVLSRKCTYFTQKQDNCEVDPGKIDTIILRDITGGDATGYSIFQQCEGELDSFEQLLVTGELDQNGIARITPHDFPLDENCQLTNCEGSSQFFIRYYDEQGHILATSDPLVLRTLCIYNGCWPLDKDCDWQRPETNTIPVLNDPLQICVDLEENESARVYYQTPSGMSPFYSFPLSGSSGTLCHEFDDLAGLAPADICLGVRTFSENHVGSRMLYLGCMELHARNKQPPPAPVLNPAEPATREGNTFFDLHWSMSAAGIGSYILRIKSPAEDSYQSLWDVQLDDMGLYPYSYKVNNLQDGEEWCFQIRALSTDMLASDWSNLQCATWQETPAENLGWPPVAEPEVEGTLGAFYLKNGADNQPVLVLSDDIRDRLRPFPLCDQIPDCIADTNESCLRTEDFSFWNCPICEFIGNALPAPAFIVYRQESGHDFVQISPLIDNFYCVTQGRPSEYEHVLHDPFIAFMDVNTSAIYGVDDPAGIGSGVRVLFKDRYPFTGGSRVRYKLVAIDPVTGEPQKVMTSNWVDTL
jgi:hypothetical protein